MLEGKIGETYEMNIENRLNSVSIRLFILPFSYMKPLDLLLGRIQFFMGIVKFLLRKRVSLDAR